MGNNAEGAAAVLAELVKQLELGGLATPLDVSAAVHTARSELSDRNGF